MLNSPLDILLGLLDMSKKGQNYIQIYVCYSKNSIQRFKPKKKEQKILKKVGKKNVYLLYY